MHTSTKSSEALWPILGHKLFLKLGRLRSVRLPSIARGSLAIVHVHLSARYQVVGKHSGLPPRIYIEGVVFVGASRKYKSCWNDLCQKENR